MPERSAGAETGGAPYRAAVLGSPVAHSLSPVLHGAAYRALGLHEWRYDRYEVNETSLVDFVSDLGPEWAGVSVTMPGKHAALGFASEVTDRAVAVGAANTLVRREAGWLADCTDVEGVVGALRGATGLTTGQHGVILGAGGTAAAALAAFAELGIAEATLAVREPSRAQAAVETAHRVGVHVRVRRLDSVDLAALAKSSDVVVSALPASAWDVPSTGHVAAAGELASATCVLDVLYDPWPTPLAREVTAAGGRVATGLDMLLHQAFGQVEWFTGYDAPRAAMRDALSEATGNQVPLNL